MAAFPAGYTLLPGLASGTGTFATGVSGDGLVVVGEADDASFNAHAVYWTDSTGPIDLGLLAGGAWAYAAATNSDGSVIVGGADASGVQHAFIWTAGGGMVDLGLPMGATSSFATAVSADGLTVSGETGNPGLSFVWTLAGGFVILAALPATSGSFAAGISSDGTRIIGYSDTTDGNEHAAHWNVAGTLTDIDGRGAGSFSRALASNSDGTIIFGEATNAASAMRWTAGGGMVDLGFLAPDGVASSLSSATADGTTATGYTSTVSLTTPLVWTQAGGLAAIPGVPTGLTAASNWFANAIAGNGSVIVGYAPIDPGPLTTAWVYGLGAGPAPPDFPLTGVVKVLLPPAELQFCDAMGAPYAAGTLEFYQPDTSTPKDTWNSPLGGDDHLNSNPLVLDAAGRALIYGDGAYRTVLRDALGNLVWDQPSFTYISACMVPVVGAADLATARQAMGITDAIEAEAIARAAADSAEATARASADATLQANIDAEIARAEAAEAALAALIAALPPPASPGNVQGGSASLDASGHCHVTFGTPFATACDSFVVTGLATGVWSGAFNVANQTTTGIDVWGSIFGSRTPASGVVFFWLATGH